MVLFHRRFPEVKISATLLHRTYKQNGVKFKYIQKVKKVIDYALPHYRDMFTKMDRLLRLAKLYKWKVVYLDEAIFSFNTFNSKAWSKSYDSITVCDDRVRIKTQALLAAISEDVGLEDYLIHPRSITAEEFTVFIKQLSQKFGGQPFAIFMDNLSVHKTRPVMDLYKELQITPIFNVPYSPDFNGIESYFSMVKAAYKRLLLQHVMNEERFQVVSLIKQALAEVEDEKTRHSAAHGVTEIKR